MIEHMHQVQEPGVNIKNICRKRALPEKVYKHMRKVKPIMKKVSN